MVSFEDSHVAAGDGGVLGGNPYAVPVMFANVPGSYMIAQKTGYSPSFSGAVILVLVVIILFTYSDVLLAYINPSYSSAFSNMYTSGAGLRFAGASPSHTGSGAFTNMPAELYKSSESRAKDWYDAKQSEDFVNPREAPYFPDVTNRVLRMENREKEAVRALGKINQERMRRAAEDSASTTPLAWGPFWREWKQTHPVDGEEGYGGVEGMVSKVESSFEKQLFGAVI